MSLVSAISRFAGIESDVPPIVLQDQQDERRALLARARRGRVGMTDVVQPPRSRSDMAGDFVEWISTTRGIELIAMDEDATGLLDAYVDSVRETDSQELSGRRGEQAAAWIGERVRSDVNLSWTDDALITDGRLAFDPSGALHARLASKEAPTIAQAVEDAKGRIERETLAATSA